MINFSVLTKPSAQTFRAPRWPLLTWSWRSPQLEAIALEAKPFACHFCAVIFSATHRSNSHDFPELIGDKDHVALHEKWWCSDLRCLWSPWSCNQGLAAVVFSRYFPNQESHPLRESDVSAKDWALWGVWRPSPFHMSILEDPEDLGEPWNPRGITETSKLLLLQPSPTPLRARLLSLTSSQRTHPADKCQSPL